MERFDDEAGLSSVRTEAEQATGAVHKLDTGVKTVGASLASVGKDAAQFNAILASGTDQLADKMGSAFERFARTGKFSFNDLKSVAVSALDDIYNQAISAGLDSIFGGSSGGGLFGGFLQGVLTSFAPRAQGGPVSAGRPYLIGESGPELFVPQMPGQIVPQSQTQAGAPLNITINMHGGGSEPAMRASASQIASQVSRAVARAQRNG
ncbi:MAG: tail tape measure protein [Pseudomonadota bacterium]